VLSLHFVRFVLPVLCSFFLLFQQSNASAREIPFTLSNGYILVQASVDSRPVTLLLDSGASASVLSLEAARSLHLATGKAHFVDGVDADGTAFDLKPVASSARGISLGDIQLAIDLRNAAQLCPRHIDGLIGAGFFEGRVTQIDYANRRIVFLDKPPAQGEPLPLRFQNGVFCLPVAVNGSKPRWTRLDTGCNDALHWVVPRIVSNERRGVSIGFVTNSADQTRVSVGLGNIRLHKVETALHASPIFPGEAGLLGGGILSRYRVTIDDRAGRIILAPAAR
jgi:hypothetical protein